MDATCRDSYRQGVPAQHWWLPPLAMQIPSHGLGSLTSCFAYKFYPRTLSFKAQDWSVKFTQLYLHCRSIFFITPFHKIFSFPPKICMFSVLLYTLLSLYYHCLTWRQYPCFQKLVVQIMSTFIICFYSTQLLFAAGGRTEESENQYHGHHHCLFL